MKVMQANNLQVLPDPLGLFFGTVERQTLLPRGAAGMVVAMVKFAPGAGNRKHTHTGEQVLVVTEGKGVVATEQEEQVVTAGTLIYIPANEMHSHGATKDSVFAHWSIQTPGETRLKP
ncbi:MAG TPA: cupin domain-containing protein [Candidatus Baltobacteraceae bacterium]|nr:cupin domain-containing protein [Candidatus Baltobacteraceae bacterium]